VINRHVQTFVVYDPGQDARIPLFKVPAGHGYTVEKAYATLDRAVSSHATKTVAIKLQNGGTDQSGTDAITDIVGGANVAWAANTAKPLTVTAGAGLLDAGEWLMLNYDENGTVAPGEICITVEYVDGIGSKA
jgi:hypothetical protein